MRRSRRFGVAALAFALLASACSSGKGKTAGESEEESSDEPSSAIESGSGGFSIDSAGSEFFGGFSSSVTPPGLTTTGKATSTTPATRAVIVVEPEPRGSLISSGGQLPAQDRKAVVDAVTALGIPRDDVSFGGRGGYGLPRVQVVMAATAVPTTGQQVIDAVERALGRAINKGVVYFAADCAAATSTVQKQAFQNAEAKARQLADNAGLKLAAPVSVTQLQGQSSPLIGRAAVDPCDPSTLEDSESVTLKTLEDKPTVDVGVGVAVTWAIAGAPAPSGSGPKSELGATGRGTSTSAPDEAYVVVVFAPEDDTEKPLSQKDRDELEQAITGLGVAKKDVDIVTGSAFGPVTILQVEVKAGDVEKRGDQIQRAAEKVLGRSDAAGVRFGLSTCPQALAKARKSAVADARSRAAALAEAVGVRIGDVQTVSELESSGGADPCADDAASLLRFSDYADYGELVKPFDSKPEFRVQSTVRLGFAVTA